MYGLYDYKYSIATAATYGKSYMVVKWWDYFFVVLRTFGKNLLQNVHNKAIKNLKQCICSLSWDAMCFTLYFFSISYYFFCNHGDDLTKCTSMLQMFFITEGNFNYIWMNTINGQLNIEKYKYHWWKSLILLYVWIDYQRWIQNPNKHLRWSLLQK